MSVESTVSSIIFNQMSDTKYGTITPTEGQFYCTPDYIDLPILTPQWFDYIVNDIQWLRADTFSWQSGDIYTTVYNHLLNDYNSVSSDLTKYVMDSNNIWFWDCPDGHKIILSTNTEQITNIENLYNSKGIAWYYILDITNHRFKLPRTKFGFTGLRDGVGNYVAPGLPDPAVDVIYRQDSTSSGVYSDLYGTDGYTGSSYSNTGGTDEWMQSSRDKGVYAPLAAIFTNSIYGASSTVQPPATQMYLYFFVGNFNKTAIEQTAGINAELVNACKSALEEFNNIKTPNYTVFRWTGLTSISSTQTKEITFTNKRGNPIFISFCGDQNGISAAAWISVCIYKNNVKVASQFTVGSSSSQNMPFSLQYLDTDVTKNSTYTYKFTVYDQGSGTTNLQENGDVEAPYITIFEL